MQIFVAGEIAIYEYDCKGTSRREDMLTLVNRDIHSTLPCINVNLTFGGM
jgi:hypothetical protein